MKMAKGSQRTATAKKRQDDRSRPADLDAQLDSALKDAGVKSTGVAPMKMETIAIGDLRPCPYNSNVHPEEQITTLVDAIATLGFNDPIEVDENLMVLSGHARLEAAKRAGMAAVPAVVLAHMTEEQKRAYVIAANQIAKRAHLDLDVIKSELKSLEAFGSPDLLITGFTQAELDILLRPTQESSSGVEDKGEPQKTTLAYNLVFDNVQQQERWFELLRWVKKADAYKDRETIAGKLVAWVDERMGDLA